jgi:hypothetical protein
VTQQKKRLVLMAETPAVAWVMYMFSLNYGVQTAWLRAGTSQAERDRIITDFNRTNGTIQVLISTHKVGGFGVNLQGGCCHMVIVELPQNLNTLLQSQSRLVRIGQTEEVYIWILFTDHTFQRWWAANLARKAISDLSAQLASKLSDGEQADPVTIDQYAEEALNTIMGWKEGRSQWSNVRELDLAKSLLSLSQQYKYASIGGAPTKADQPSEVQTGKKRKRQEEKSRKSGQLPIHAETDQNVVLGQHSAPSSAHPESDQNVVPGQQPGPSTTRSQTRFPRKAKGNVQGSNMEESDAQKSNSKSNARKSKSTQKSKSAKSST